MRLAGGKTANVASVRAFNCRPNTITAIGFMFNLWPYFHHQYFYDEPTPFYGDLSSEFLLFIGISFIIYHFCDNSDGKQARRTGSSSPLGMLFDHGADCLTTVVNYFMVARICQLGESYMAVMCLFFSTMPFYYFTLEHYYVGKLVLPEVNGVDEGSWVYLFCCILLSQTGLEFMREDIHYPYFGVGKAYHFFFYSGLAFFGVTTLANFYCIFTRHSKKDLKTQKKTIKWRYFVTQALFYPLNLGIFTVATYYSPGDIAK